jgi:hypothetical protein
VANSFGRMDRQGYDLQLTEYDDRGSLLARDAACGVGGAEEDGLTNNASTHDRIGRVGEPMNYLALWFVSIVELN